MIAETNKQNQSIRSKLADLNKLSTIDGGVRDFVNFHFFIGHVNKYPTMHSFGIPRHTQSMIAYKSLTEYFWKFQCKIALWECC